MTATRSLASLWLPVPVFAAAGYLLVRADLLVQSGVPDLDPLAALGTMFIALVTGCGGVVALVLAVTGAFARTWRAGLRLGGAIWATGTLLPFTLFLVWMTHAEPTYAGSTTMGQQLPLQALAALLAVAPLVVELLVRRAERSAAPTAPPAPMDRTPTPPSLVG